MFERFSQEARQVIVLAQEEARALRHNYIGTEHLLLGLLRVQDDLATEVLRSFGFTFDQVRAAIQRIVAAGDEPPGSQIPFTPRAKKALELALREALGLGDNYIGTGHLLLGLLRDDEGVAIRILLDSEIDLEAIRRQTIDRLGSQRPQQAMPSVRGERAAHTAIDLAWMGSLGIELDGLARDIRRELGREPDSGDLLLALACAQGTPAAAALGALGVDLDELWVRTETARRALVDERAKLESQLAGIRTDKQAAIEAGEVPTAAELRDRERELAKQLRRLGAAQPNSLGEARRRLGIPESQ